MENKIEKIMKKYKKELDKIDQKYEVKPISKKDTKELDEKIQHEKEFIAKLEFESKELNAGMIEKAKERLAEAMNEKTKIDLKYEEDLLKRNDKILKQSELKNSKVVLESGREVKMSEKDELDKAELKNKVIRELTSESKSISEALLAKKAELESKRKEWNEFKYEYERDENGKLIPTNKAEVEKIHAEFDNIKKEMTELDKMQKQCDRYLTELKAPTKQDKDFMKTWSDVATKTSENTQPTQQQPTQPQPQPTQPQQTQPQPTQPQQTQPQPTQPQSTQPQQTQPQPTQPTPVKKELEIRIGKKLEVTRYKKDGFETIEIPMEDYKDSLDPDGPCSKEMIYDELSHIFAENPNIGKKELEKLTKEINPIIWEALRKVDIDYTFDYLDMLVDNTRQSKIDIVYDENQYENRNIIDRIKALPFIRKGLNKKETEMIGRYAYKDVEKRKIARIIPKADKKAERLNSPDPKSLNGHSEFVKRLEEMAKINDDPDMNKDPNDIEKENKRKAQAAKQNSDDYLDRF